MSSIKDLLEKIDADKIAVTLDIGVGLIKAGNEILQLLKSDNDLSDIEILELIEKHDGAKKEAREALIDSIKRRRDKSLT